MKILFHIKSKMKSHFNGAVVNIICEHVDIEDLNKRKSGKLIKTQQSAIPGGKLMRQKLGEGFISQIGNLI